MESSYISGSNSVSSRSRISHLAPRLGEQSPPAIACTGLSRAFGVTRALRGVDLEVSAGTVHAFVGENGAGKSTCLGLIAGRLSADEGEVQLFGERLQPGDPRAARRAGVAAVYQELTTVPHLSPQANVFLAAPLTRSGFLAERRMRREYVEACQRLGIPAAPDVEAGTLSVAEQQLIEIVRAVHTGARVVLLDEPTTALSIAERDALFRLLGSLRSSGVTIVLVSHNLGEVLGNSDHVTVFRDGRVVATRAAGDWSRHQLVAAMLGDRALAELGDAADGRAVAPTVGPRPVRRTAQPPVLRAEGVTLPGRAEAIDLEVRAGEILGVGGLVGSGRTSVLRALAGAERGAEGRMWIDGSEVRWPRTPRQARALGIALIPEDRKGQGLALRRPVADNAVLGDYGKAARSGYVRPSRLVAAVLPSLHEARVDSGRVMAPARTLSGGNQQKLLFARWIHARPKILLADEPTRGVDLGAKTDLLRQLAALATDSGLGVIFVSSELEEVVSFSDRVLVLAAGACRGVLDAAQRPITVADILHLAFDTTGAAA